MQVINIDINQVPQFSKKDKAYLSGLTDFDPFVQYPFDFDNFQNIINERSQFPCDRTTLVNVLLSQYDPDTTSQLTLDNIRLLQNDNCFTVTTAHQPTLMTGPLYYVYKILSTVKLVQRLRNQFGEHQFVPVFIIGGEDHDFDEMNHFHLYQKRIEWLSKGSGSVGDYSLEGFHSVLASAKEILGSNENTDVILKDLEQKMSLFKNYGDLSFYLTKQLFDHLGLVILRMDKAELKSLYKPIIKAEILNQESQPIVKQAQEKIMSLGFEPQTYIRDINFFYKKDNIRKRIEFDGTNYIIVDSDIMFSKDQMLEEIESHPERFSPNVIMRPLYQELCLPNLAYIGGGGEIAYWLERKSLFQHFNIHFPMLIRRMSAMIMSEGQYKQLEKLGLKVEDLFRHKDDVIKTYLELSDAPDYKLDVYRERIAEIFNEIALHIKQIDQSLEKTVHAESAKSQKSVDYLESKLKKSVKQKEEIQINRINKLVDRLFPKGLQERHDNVFEYISQYGQGMVDRILEHSDPFDKTFKVFVMQR